MPLALDVARLLETIRPPPLSLIEPLGPVAVKATLPPATIGPVMRISPSFRTDSPEAATPVIASGLAVFVRSMDPLVAVPLNYTTQLAPNSGFCFAMDPTKVMRNQTSAAAYCAANGHYLPIVHNWAEYGALRSAR